MKIRKISLAAVILLTQCSLIRESDNKWDSISVSNAMKYSDHPVEEITFNDDSTMIFRYFDGDKNEFSYSKEEWFEEYDCFTFNFLSKKAPYYKPEYLVRTIKGDTMWIYKIPYFAEEENHEEIIEESLDTVEFSLYVKQ